jgi:membrane protease YdiL (CAAX protease family)
MPAAGRNLRWAFIGPDGARACWRFAAFAGFWYVSGYILFPLVSLVHTFSDTGFTPADILAYKLVEALYMLAISVLLVRLEKHRISWSGLPFNMGAFKLLGMGYLWGGAAVTLLLLIASLGGGVSFSGFALHGADLWKYLVLWLVGTLVAGCSEELQFRGYTLSALGRGMGFWPAALLLSLLFGADHLSKPMENVPDILNIVLLGLFVCYSVRRTGGIWFAVGFHAAFNFCALALYGSPNTGNKGLPLENHLLDTHIGGPSWLTGGPQGLEASWLLIPLLVVMFLLLTKLYPENRFPPE